MKFDYVVYYVKVVIGGKEGGLKFILTIFQLNFLPLKINDLPLIIGLRFNFGE